MRLTHVFLICWLHALVTASGFAADPIVTTDLLRVRSVSSIDVSKDGSQAVFAVRSIATMPSRAPQSEPGPAPAPGGAAGAAAAAQALDAEYRYQSHLFLLDLRDEQSIPRQMTFGERNDRQPQFSSDGKQIAFIRSPAASADPATQSDPSQVGGDAKSQLWVMHVDGGEARQVTNFKFGCSSPKWSPDGRSLLVSVPLPISEFPKEALAAGPGYPIERPKRAWNDAKLPEGVQPDPAGTRDQIRAWLERNASKSNPVVIDRLEFQDEQRIRGPMRFDQLYLVDVPGETSSRSGRGPRTEGAPDVAPIELQAARRISTTFYDYEDHAFTSDGRGVLCITKTPREDQHPDRTLSKVVRRINLNDNADRVILALEGWALSSPKPSRDGAVIAFLGERIDEPAFRQTQLGLAKLPPVIPSAAAPPEAGDALEINWLTQEDSFPASVRSFEWIPAQAAAIAFSAAMRGSFPLMTISAGVTEPVIFVGGGDGESAGAGVHAFDVGGGTTVYSLTTASNPCVLMVKDARGERMALDLNEWVNNKSLSEPIEAWVTRPDGQRIQYWVMPPTNIEAGKKYPTVLQIHGGPSAMWGPSEFTMWHEFQLLCSWGYGVVYANPRGSGGYGYQFQRGNFQDWGEGPAGDVLAALEAAAARHEWIDQSKLVITGGSYAGYLTAWIIAHDHRFKAAVAQRGVYDLSTFFGEGNAWRLVSWAMGGNPYDPRYKQIIERNSPFTHVNRIRTPLLILHASQDLRTGVSQSEMMYRALKEMGKPVEYVRYPDEGHDLSRSGDPKRRMDRLNRIIEFFERHIENPRPAPVGASRSS